MKTKITKSDISILLFYAILSYFTIFFSCDITIGEEAIPKWHAFAAISTLFCMVILCIPRDIIIRIDEATLLLSLFIFYLLVRSLAGISLNIGILYFVFFVILVFAAKAFDNYFLPILLITACVVQSVVGILQYCDFLYSPFSNGISGTFDNPAGYATCLAVTYPLCFLILKRSKYERIFGIFSIILIVTGVLLSASRTGIISIVAVSVIYAIASLKRAKVIPIATSMGLLIATFTSLFFFKVDSIDGRLLIWKISFGLMKENLIFGGGYGAFRANYMSLQGDYFATNPESQFSQLADNVSQPFNEYIKLISEFGFVGLVLLIAFFGYMVITVKKNNPYLLCLISLAIFSFFSYPLSYPYTLVIAAYCIGRISDVFPRWLFKITLPWRLVLFVVSCIVSALIFYSIEFDMRWNRACDQSSFGKRDNLMTVYDSLHNIWDGNPKFLYNYSVELEKDGQTERSIEIMNECKKRINDYHVNIFLGEIYSKNKKYDLAEQHYMMAKNMVPNRFLPLGQLLRVYEAQSKNGQAIEIANEILCKEIKVPSAEVSWVIVEARKFIEKQPIDF